MALEKVAVGDERREERKKERDYGIKKKWEKMKEEGREGKEREKIEDMKIRDVGRSHNMHGVIAIKKTRGF